MSTNLSQTDRYDATPAQIWAMLSDPGYGPAKYEYLGDLSFNVVEQSASDAAMSATVERTVKSNATGPAAKVLGDKSDMKQKEDWSAKGDGYAGRINIASGPVKINGEMGVTPVSDSQTD